MLGRTQDLKSRAQRENKNQTIQEITRFQKALFHRKKAKFPVISASKDAAKFIHWQNRCPRKSTVRKPEEESFYYRVRRGSPIEQKESTRRDVCEWKTRLGFRTLSCVGADSVSGMHRSLIERLMERREEESYIGN